MYDNYPGTSKRGEISSVVNLPNSAQSPYFLPGAFSNGQNPIRGVSSHLPVFGGHGEEVTHIDTRKQWPCFLPAVCCSDSRYLFISCTPEEDIKVLKRLIKQSVNHCNDWWVTFAIGQRATHHFVSMQNGDSRWPHYSMVLLFPIIII